METFLTIFFVVWGITCFLFLSGFGADFKWPSNLKEFGGLLFGTYLASAVIVVILGTVLNIFGVNIYPSGSGNAPDTISDIYRDRR